MRRVDAVDKKSAYGQSSDSAAAWNKFLKSLCSSETDTRDSVSSYGLAITLFIVCITALIMESEEKIDKGG